MIWIIIKLVAIGFCAITGALCLIKEYKENKQNNIEDSAQ